MILNLKDKNNNLIKVNYKNSYILQTKSKLIPYARDSKFVYFIDSPKLRKELIKHGVQVQY